MNDIIPTEIVNDGIGQLYYLLPLPFIALVLGTSIWLGFTKLSGVVKTNYKLYNVITAIIFAAISYFIIPVDESKVNDIPTLIISIISSGVVVEIFIYWRQKKTRLKTKK